MSFVSVATELTRETVLNVFHNKTMMGIGLQDKKELSPLWACILIGGKSSRMGQPKHLMKHPLGTTWLEETVSKVEPFVEKIVIAGKGDLPDSLVSFERIEDYPNVAGPLAGIMGAAHRHPEISWLLVACDMPLISKKSVHWLTEQRSGECLAVMPKSERGKGFVEPLFACYEAQIASLFEDIVKNGSLKISDICKYEGVCLKQIPAELAKSWTNANTPEDAGKLTTD